MIRFSFIVPIYNDGVLAEPFCKKFEQVFQEFLGINNIAEASELIFVNDGSKNDSQSKLEHCAKLYKFVRVIDLSRNFGQHLALTAGFDYAVGEYVGFLNVDQEDPISEIPKLYQHLIAQDFDIVTGLRSIRKRRLSTAFTSKLFHFALNKLTGAHVPINCANLRIMNRRFIDAYKRLNESTRYIPGLEIWLGFKRGYLPIAQAERTVGKSSYNFKRRLRLATDSILSFSDLPLRMTVGIGFLTSLIGMVLFLVLIFRKLYLPNVVPGYTSTLAAIVLLGGIQFIVIGITGLYIGRILREVQRRPLYLVRSVTTG